MRLLREELQLLQEQGSYVGEVVKPMDKKKVLVKVNMLVCLFLSFTGFDDLNHAKLLKRLIRIANKSLNPSEPVHVRKLY